MLKMQERMAFLSCISSRHKAHITLQQVQIAEAATARNKLEVEQQITALLTHKLRSPVAVLDWTMRGLAEDDRFTQLFHGQGTLIKESIELLIGIGNTFVDPKLRAKELVSPSVSTSSSTSALPLCVAHIRLSKRAAWPSAAAPLGCFSVHCALVGGDTYGCFSLLPAAGAIDDGPKCTT
jgi:hypothetical protein